LGPGLTEPVPPAGGAGSRRLCPHLDQGRGRAEQIGRLPDSPCQYWRCVPPGSQCIAPGRRRNRVSSR